jgi:hypothetical protein
MPGCSDVRAVLVAAVTLLLTVPLYMRAGEAAVVLELRAGFFDPLLTTSGWICWGRLLTLLAA